MLNVAEWGWRAPPKNDAEFEAMMESLDSYLASRGAIPHQRALMGRVLVSELLNVSTPIAGSIFGLSDKHPTVERTGDWFQSMYEDRINPHFRARSIAFELRGTAWRLRFGVAYGEVQVFLDQNMQNRGAPIGQGSRNVLHYIDGMNQFYASRLSERELDHIMEMVELGDQAINALEMFPDDNLANAARLDYEHSVDAIISGVAWNKAKWETAQTAEKLMKSMLAAHRIDFPKGAKGHNIPHIGKLVRDNFDIEIPDELLQVIDCSTAIRYGEDEATSAEAMAAHAALLGLLPILVNALLRGPRKS